MFVEAESLDAVAWSVDQSGAVTRRAIGRRFDSAHRGTPILMYGLGGLLILILIIILIIFLVRRV